MSAYLFKEMESARMQFYQLSGGAVVAIFLIHLIPKNPDAQWFRFALTVIYFTAVLVFLWSLTRPFQYFIYKRMIWQYAEGGPTLQHAVLLFWSSFTTLTTPLAWILMGEVAVTALRTLLLWPQFGALRNFESTLTLMWWIFFLSFPAYLFFNSQTIRNLWLRYELLGEQALIENFKPQTLQKGYQNKCDRQDLPPVLVLGEYQFHAGGIDWSWEDLYKNCIVFGQSGTGKTVCVLNALFDGLIASTEKTSFPAAGLILDPKGDYRNKVHALCKKYGRGRDLLILDPNLPSESIRWNPFDSDDDELELSGRFSAVLESLGMKAGEDSFWLDSAKTFIRHALSILRLTNPPVDPPNLLQVLELAGSLDSIIERAVTINPFDSRATPCLQYFDKTWSEMPEKTRSSVQAFIVNMIDPFLMPPFNTIFSGKSTMRLAEMIDKGKILYVYMPVADREAMSRIVCTFIKLEYYREVLKRPDKKRSSFFLCDEFQSFFTAGQNKGDADFFERSRQSNHANIIATQNLHALYKQVPTEKPVKNLLGNCAVKLFLRNTDAETNEYASGLFGQRIVQMIGSSNNISGGFRLSQVSTGHNTTSQYDARVRTEVFTELAVPSRADRVNYAESMLHLASRGRVVQEKLRWRVHPLKYNQ